MQVTVTGGTGFIGRHLAERLRRDGHGLELVGRRLPEQLEVADAVIHLAGEPVAQRWNKAVKQRIESSRVDGTRSLVVALRKLPRRPSVLISASATGYYGSRGDEVLTEESLPGGDFLSQVCIGWEKAADEADPLGIRVVKLRFGMVLAPDGGALGKMLLPFRAGIGGTVGSGMQWMPWIHVGDVVGLISFALDHPDMRGVLNATAPNPVTNAEFTRQLAKALHRVALFPVPVLVLKMMYGEMAGVVLSSQRVVPQATLAAGYEFRYPELAPALRDLLG